MIRDTGFQEQILAQRRLRAESLSAGLARSPGGGIGVMPLSGPQSIERVPIIVNLLLYAGDDLGFALLVYDADGSDSDLSGATVRAQIRANPAAQQVAGEVLCTIDGNAVQLHILGTVSQNLPGAAVWDCEMTRGGMVTTLVAGTVRTTADVTRDVV